jgi:AraC family transcriptional regulator of adaptative response/methylated-DNA-[protein]-cysteine methyltransferase
MITRTLPPPAAPAAAAERWRIVVARDRRYDGLFVYAVRSTGIYCRPSCPSRRPRRELVAFFGEPAAAERAGYRPCRRCRPGTPDPARDLVRRACALLDARHDEPWSPDALARALAARPRQLARAFRRVLGVTPRQYREARRLERLKTNLRERKRVSTALYDAGYSGSSRVYERSNSQLGMTPATYAKGGVGMRIAFAVASSPLGRLLVAATERGICRVAFGDDDATLERMLRAEFPAARIARDSGPLARSIEALGRHLDGREPDLDLPLDVRATAFQRRVWDALRKIPYGQTRSYADVARAIGRPRAVRAVARACATNPVAIVVPCHRVVREDGELGGYRWGTRRKATLIEREAADIRQSWGTPGHSRPAAPATGAAGRAPTRKQSTRPAAAGRTG